MSEDTPRPPARGRWRAVVVGLLLFASGVVCGAGGGLLVVRRQIQLTLAHPDRAAEALVRTLTRRLDLTPDQQAAVRTIVHERQGRLLDLRQRFRPLLEAELAAGVEAVAEVLSPDQQVRWRRWVARAQRYRPAAGPEPTADSPAPVGDG